MIKVLEELKIQAKEDLPEQIEIKEPMKYWRDDKFDIFEPNKLYKAFWDYEYEVEYSEFAFFLRRGNTEKVKELAK